MSVRFEHSLVHLKTISTPAPAPSTVSLGPVAHSHRVSEPELSPQVYIYRGSGSLLVSLHPAFSDLSAPALYLPNVRVTWWRTSSCSSQAEQMVMAEWDRQSLHSLPLQENRQRGVFLKSQKEEELWPTTSLSSVLLKVSGMLLHYSTPSTMGCPTALTMR